MKTLYKHQQELLDKNPPRHLVSWGTGCGKSLTAIELAKKNGVVPLIIVPKALKQQWVLQVPKTWRVITKEEFRRDWDRLPAHDAWICDEFHYFGNIKSQLSKALLSYSAKHKIRYRWGLTATPFRSSPMDIFALAKHLGHKWDYWAFFTRFYSQVRMGHRMIPVAKKGKEKELATLVKEIGSTAKLQDLIDLPPQVHEVEYFELTKEQIKGIKDLQETNYIVRFTKTHEIEQGVLNGGPYGEDVSYPSFKVDRVLELSEEHAKLAVFCRYNLQIDNLKDVLEKAGKKVWIIRGDVKDRASVVREIDSAESGVVLINAMCSEGYELPSIRTFIFASLSWSFVNFVQACGRNNRINRPERNLYITLVVKDGVDHDVFNAIERKKDFSIEIYKT